MENGLENLHTFQNLQNRVAVWKYYEYKIPLVYREFKLAVAKQFACI